jgi:hypothetical protein
MHSKETLHQDKYKTETFGIQKLLSLSTCWLYHNKSFYDFIAMSISPVKSFLVVFLLWKN